jgi:hypothetical protein
MQIALIEEGRFGIKPNYRIVERARWRLTTEKGDRHLLAPVRVHRRTGVDQVRSSHRPSLQDELLHPEY